MNVSFQSHFHEIVQSPKTAQGVGARVAYTHELKHINYQAMKSKKKTETNQLTAKTKGKKLPKCENVNITV